MLIVLKSAAGIAFFGSLFFLLHCSYLAVLLLGAWVLAIAFMVRANLGEKFLWIPVVLALAGVLGSVFVLAIPANLTLAVNEATLFIFAFSLGVLKKHHHSSSAAIRNRHC